MGGKNRIRGGNARQADGRHHQFPQTSPKSISQLFQQATKFHQQGDLKNAANLYQRILSCAPDHADTLYLLGVIHSEHDYFDEALKLFSKAITLNPKF